MGSVAALWGSWAKRTPARFFPSPAPSRGSAPPVDGGTGGPIGLTVELNLGALGWTDISPYVLYRNSTQLVTITRGRPNETSSIQPQTATFQVNNRDGRFSPRNPNGPYYGNIGRNTQVRISRMQNGVRRYRFHGEVTAWPTTWEISGNDVWIDVSAAGMLRRLQQGTQTLGSAMYRAYALGESATLNPVAYWPCEDGATATEFSSGMGGAPMSFTGTPQLASNSAFQCSLPLPVINGSSWYGKVPTGGVWTDNVLRFLMAIPPSGDRDTEIVATMYTNGTVKRVDLRYGDAGAGSLSITGYDAAAVQLFFAPGAPGFDLHGAAMRVSVELKTSGSDVVYQWGVFRVGDPQVWIINGTLAGASIGAVTQVAINPHTLLTSSAFGHISVQPVVDNLFDLGSQLEAWYTEAPFYRFFRLCSEQNVNAVDADPAVGNVGGNGVTMGYQLSDTLANLVQQAADTDGDLIFEARDQLALARRGRIWLCNQGTVYNPQRGLTLDVAQHQLSGPLDPLDDDTYTRNDVTVQAIAGSFARATLASGALSTQDPPGGAGLYATTYTLSLGNLATSLDDHAHWRLHLGTVDEPRYPRIRLNLRHPQFTSNVDLLNQALVMDIGDLVVINNPPAWMAPDQIRQILQGYTETLGVFEHDMVLNCSPEAPYRVGMVGDAVLAVADTDGSTLVADNGATITVASTNPLLPLWTTKAGSFPFDIGLSPGGSGGERVTVTNITGATSPQTFTVTRAVNGVARTWPAGTDVRLWQPCYVSL